MHPADPIVLELYCQAAGRKLEPCLIRSIISLQRGWQASRSTANPEEGFLATAFEEGEVLALYEDGGSFFIIRRGDEVVGFALTTGIEKFVEQYDAPAGGQLHLNEPLDLAKFVYLYQVVIQKGEQQRGLGTRLMQHVQRYHTQPLLADILSSPIPNIGSSVFFARLGFRKVGELNLSNYRDYGPLTSEVLVNTVRESS